MACETHRLPVDGAQSIVIDHYRAAAAAPAALFVHGLGSNRRGEKALHFAERFNANGWNFAALDLRGHGDSDGSMSELSLSRMLADAGAALRWLAAHGVARRPVLIGSSMGAAVAIWYALAHPDETGPLALIAPALTFPAGFVGELSSAEMQAWQRAGRRRFRSEWLDIEIGYGLIEDAARYDPARLRAGHRAPTLILHGMRDEAVDWRDSLTFVEQCRSTRIDLTLFKDGDHRLTERKALLFDSIWSWLESLGG